MQNTETELSVGQSRSNFRTSSVAFSGMQVHSIVDENEEESEEKLEMMLDSGSTVTLGKDRKLFTSITNLERKVRMKTNAGSKQIS